jgi:hypothetical protein
MRLRRRALITPLSFRSLGLHMRRSMERGLVLLGMCYRRVLWLCSHGKYPFLHRDEDTSHNNCARIGEKFLDWSDETTTPPLDTILTNVSLYWFTGSFPRSSKYQQTPFAATLAHFWCLAVYEIMYTVLASKATFIALAIVY